MLLKPVRDVPSGDGSIEVSAYRLVVRLVILPYRHRVHKTCQLPCQLDPHVLRVVHAEHVRDFALLWLLNHRYLRGRGTYLPNGAELGFTKRPAFSAMPTARPRAQVGC